MESRKSANLKKSIAKLSIPILSFGLLWNGMFACSRQDQPRNYFPETGKAAVEQSLKELGSNLSVLSIALQPGFEDLPTLAYLRLAKGGTVMSAFVTNGEAGDCDTHALTPPYLAQELRREATAAMDFLKSETFFLNFPDVAAAASVASVRRTWQTDSLSAKLKQLILQFKPDIILIAQDFRFGQESVRLRALTQALQIALKELLSGRASFGGDVADAPQWKVASVLIETPNEQTLRFPVSEKNSIWRKSYLSIGAEASRFYRIQQVQFSRWNEGRSHTYAPLRGETRLPDALESIFELEPCTRQLQKLNDSIQRFVKTAYSLSKDQLLDRLTAIKDSVNVLLAQQNSLEPCEKRWLLQWNFALNNLKNALLNIQVDYRLSDTLVTRSQVTILRVLNLKGEIKEGKTDIFFAGIDNSWGINEDVRRRFPLALNEDYRILTPAKLAYHLPPNMIAEHSSTFGKTIYFFIIHEAKDHRYSFIHRNRLRLFFAPQFVIEVKNPIVRLRPNQKIYFKITNISRDGVMDTLRIQHPKFSSWISAFRLPGKEASVIDSLPIWTEDEIEIGSHVVPLQTTLGIPVANIVIRNFPAEVNQEQRIGVIPSLAGSPTIEMLHQLNLKPVILESPQEVERALDSLDVVILDERLLLLHPEFVQLQTHFQRFAEAGGHLIVLAQEVSVWNQLSVFRGIQLQPRTDLEREIEVDLAPNSILLSQPNQLINSEFDGWLFLRASQSVRILEPSPFEILIASRGDRSPLLVSGRVGQGRVTYCALALLPQFQNVHAGAFRLMANLVSWKPSTLPAD